MLDIVIRIFGERATKSPVMSGGKVAHAGHENTSFPRHTVEDTFSELIFFRSI